ncbi:MAG: hypothetical protein ACU0DW_10500 [Shimia sp.]
MKKRIQIGLVIVALAMTASACSRAQIADNTAEAALGATKLAVRGAVGATKLAVRGGVAAVEAARASQAARTDFPAGTSVCQNAQGGFYAALETEDGQLTCLPPAD